MQHVVDFTLNVDACMFHRYSCSASVTGASYASGKEFGYGIVTKVLRKHLDQMGKVFTKVLSATLDRSKLHQRRVRHFVGQTLNVRHILCARAQMQRAFNPFHNVGTSAWHGFQTGQML